jgi:histidinol dehydrogenase
VRRSVGFDDIWPPATEIVADVRERGDAALDEWAGRLGDPPPARVPVGPQQLDADVKRALRPRVETVTAVHSAEGPEDVTVEPAAAPARAAGVERICVVTPQPVPATIAAAELLGVDELYAAGGAHAIAALAFGTETIAPVDEIVGPGNRWVTAAKVLVSAHVGVDLPAGPSEVVVIADESADPELCLADLKPVESVHVTRDAACGAAEMARPLARVEGLTAHGEALAAR